MGARARNGTKRWFLARAVMHLMTSAGEGGASWIWHPRPGSSVWAKQCDGVTKGKKYTPNPPQINGTKVRYGHGR